MPILSFTTNVSADKVNEAKEKFLTEMSKLVASEVGKPEKYVCVHINGGQAMSFGGTEDPCGIVELQNLGEISAAKKKQILGNIGALIQEKFGIPLDRMYVKFVDVPRCDMGWNGNMFG